jgi:hypothetical protein
MFRAIWPTKQISAAAKPFSAFGADIWKQPTAMRMATKRRSPPGTDTGDSQMRTISFILAFAFILAGPSMAGSSENGLPGIGTFAYNGSPVVPTAAQLMVVAAK